MRIAITSLLLLVSGLLAGQEKEKVKLQTVRCSNDTSQQYALYLPSVYSATGKYPLIIFLDPGARGELPVGKYSSLAEEYGVVMAGSFSSRNFDPSSSVKAFVAIYNDLLLHYSIDPSMVWIAGFSGGSRAAASIAMDYPQIAGVIACGAGFAGDEEPSATNLKGYAALVGDQDMNYSELVENAQYLSEKKMDNLLLIFPGDHRWPPSAYVGLAIGWLMEKAGKEQAVSSAKEFLAMLRAKMDSGYLYQAWMEAGQLSKIKIYHDQAIALQATIETKKGWVADKQDFQNAATDETSCMNEFSILFSSVVYKDAYIEKSVWQKIAKRTAMMQKEKSRYRQLAGQRALNHCTLSCYEQYGHLMNDKLYKTAFSVAEVLSAFLPSDPQPYFMMARVEAAKDDKKQAEKYLREAVKKGLKWNGRIETDTFLLGVFTMEELKRIVQGE